VAEQPILSVKTGVDNLAGGLKNAVRGAVVSHHWPSVISNHGALLPNKDVRPWAHAGRDRML